MLGALAVVAAVAGSGCAAAAGPSGATGAAGATGLAPGAAVDPAVVRIESPPGVERPPFRFGAEDEAFLDEIQRGAFNFMWAGANPTTGMVPDRTSKRVVSVAGVGFQLAAIVVGVERGWITRDQGRERCELILRTLLAKPEIRTAGLFQHFIDGDTGGLHDGDLEHVVSTIDSALLFCGILTAGSYFGGEVRRVGDEIVAAADWTFFRGGDEGKPHERGFITLGWKPADPKAPQGAGGRLPYYWIDTGCEHRLVTFLAVAAPLEKHAVEPSLYYRLRRPLGTDPASDVFVFLPYSGALFVGQFSHLFLDYAGMGVDDPAAHGGAGRARVDWWENSRRMTLMHRAKVARDPAARARDGGKSWGLTASDCPRGYCVPGLFPAPLAMAGAADGRDFDARHTPKDDFGDGTIAPYGAGSAIMHDPEAALGALRHYRALAARPGLDRLWADPASGGYGFADAFNLEKGWVAPDHLAIDQGPLLLAIENARTGLLWRQFHAHPMVQAGLDRLGLRRLR